MRALLHICGLTVAFSALAGGQTPLTRADAIRDAVARSPRSGVLLADTSVAFAQLLSARAISNPALSASYSKAPPNIHVTADVPVDFLFLRGNRVAAANLARTAAQYRYQLGRAIVALDADTTYTRALAAAERSRLSARSARDADSLLQMVIARRNAGDASELDVQIATVSATQQDNLAAGDSLSAISALLDLQSVLGLASGDVVTTLADSLTEPPAVAAPNTLATLPIAAAEADLRAAALNVIVQRRAIWSGTGFTFGVETKDPDTGSAPLPLFGITVPLPFFDRNRGGRAEAAAEQQRAEWSLSLAKVETQSEIAHATRARNNALGRVARDRVTVAAANQVAAMSLRAYSEGAMALPTVLEAQRTAREVLAQYIDDLAEAWIATSVLRAFNQPVVNPNP